MRTGDAGAARESVRSPRIILKVGIVNQSKIVIEPPVIGVIWIPNSAKSIARCGMPAPLGGFGAKKSEPNS